MDANDTEQTDHLDFQARMTSLDAVINNRQCKTEVQDPAFNPLETSSFSNETKSSFTPGKPDSRSRKRHFVYQYVELQDNNTGICCKCGQLINGASAGNIQSHLKHKHKEFFETILEEAKRSRRFEEVLNYGRSEPLTRKLAINFAVVTRSLTLGFATSTTPLMLVENEFFKRALEGLGYKVPHRQMLRQNILAEAAFMQEVIRDRLKRASTIVVSFNTMKKTKDLASCLNLMFHYCDRKDETYETLLFDVIPWRAGLTAATVKQLVVEALRNYGISYPNVFWFGGDNASCINAAVIDARENPVAKSGNTTEFFEEACTELEEVYEEDFSQSDTCDYNPEVEDTEFYQHFLRYHPCAVDTLMRVLNSSTTAVGIVQKLMQTASSMIREINSSFELTKALRELQIGRRLIAPVDNGWLAIYHTFKHFYECKNAVKSICEEFHLGSLSESDFELINEIARILEPFVEVISQWKQDELPTVSFIIPCVLLLEDHLKAYCGNRNAAVALMAEELLEALRLRFKFAFTNGQNQNDSLYLLATFLDRRTCALLPFDRQKVAADMLKAMIRQYDGSKSSAALPDAPPSFTDKLYSRFMSSRIIESAKLDAETDEVSQYLSNYGLKPVVGYFNPLKFWTDNAKLFPELSNLAFSYLAVPASSVDAKRSSFLLKLYDNGCRGRDDEDIMRAKALLTFNQKFLVLQK